MDDHLHAAGLQALPREEPTPKNIVRLDVRNKGIGGGQTESKTRVVFSSSPGYASMPPALQFVCAILVLIAEGIGLRMLMAAPYWELEPKKPRLLKSEVAAACAYVFHALRGFYELANILIV